MNIFLDDIRLPKMSHNLNRGLGAEYSNIDQWVIVREYFEFVNVIKNNFDKVKLISFDHDLACYKNDREWTGKDAADFVINYCFDNNKKFPNWYVHSDNTSGKRNIISAITNYLKVVENRDISNFRYYNSGMYNNNPI